jgi:hypothetical protein
MMLFKMKSFVYGFIFIVCFDVVACNVLNSQTFGLVAFYLNSRFTKEGIDCKWFKQCFKFGNFFEEIYSKHKNLINEAVLCLSKNKDIEQSKLKDLRTLGLSVLQLRRWKFKESFVDLMALVFAELKKDAYILVSWPASSYYRTTIEQELKCFSDVIYKKDIIISARGKYNLTNFLYGKMKWFKSRKNLLVETAIRFKGRSDLKIFLFTCDSYEIVLKNKKRMRKALKMENASLHINDFHDETVLLAQLFFNKNSLHFINNKSSNLFPKFKKFFNQYKDWLEKSGRKKDYFCIDNGFVLGAYGLRDGHDLDFVHFKNEDLSIVKGGHNCKAIIPSIESHNHRLAVINKVYKKKLNKIDIIFNPEKHFYYKGMKVASLDVVKEIKRDRRECDSLNKPFRKKDQRDVQMINFILSN